MSEILFLGYTPEQFKEDLLEGVKSQLQDFKASVSKPNEEYLTREQTAKLLDVDISTLWHWKNRGVLLPYGIGNRVYYKSSDIEKAMVKLK